MGKDIELTKEQEVYLALAAEIKRLRECNWIDIATGVAQVMENYYPALQESYNRKAYAEELVKGTEVEARYHELHAL